MSTRQEYTKLFGSFIFLATALVMLNLYYYVYALLNNVGLTNEIINELVFVLRDGGAFSSWYITKGIAMALVFLSCIVRSGKGTTVEPATVAAVGIISLFLYLYPFKNPLAYLVCTLSGYLGWIWTVSMIGRLFTRFHEHDNDVLESFVQEDKPVRVSNGIVLPTRYYYKKRWHSGYISVTNPFRGTLIVGSAGSGKSFSVFNPYIEQMIEQGYTMMLYDFKMPDLTKVVYNALLCNKKKYKRTPQFYCINFKDPMKSNRCNPIAVEYLTDVADASETARVVMEALNKGNDKKDFFLMSAQQYVGLCLWLLRIYTPPGGSEGDWCDFPHLIELINQDYNKVLQLVKRRPDLVGKGQVFIDALDAGAQDQLQGQIASARIPLNDISSPALYWVLSGNDFNLDLNDPDDPKILCIGNDPDRQNIYGTALSLFSFRVIKRVNKPGRLPCSIVVDELPTISVQGLDGLMATARSNKVAVVLGIQDISQITADYGEKVAEKIIALPANIFVGASSLKTAEKYSKEFGKEFRRQESQTQNIDSESINISFHEEEIMPVRKITTLPQGTFVGRVAVDNDTPIKQPFFSGAIKINMKKYRRKQKKAEDIPELYDFDLGNILEVVKTPGIGNIYIDEYLSKNIIKRWRWRGKRVFTKEELRDAVQARRDKLSDTQVDNILKKMLPEIWKREVERIVEENFYNIKNDIKNLLEREMAKIEEESSEEMQEPNSGREMRQISEEKQVIAEQLMLEDLNLKPNILMALRSNGINTVLQLIQMTGRELMRLEGIGSKRSGSIRNALKNKNLDLFEEK